MRFSSIFCFLYLAIFLLSPTYSPAYEGLDKTETSGMLVKINESEAGKRQKNKIREIDNLKVTKGEEFSLFKTMVLDLVLPGGGHFYRGDNSSGFLFMTMKFAGAFSIYYFYRRWNRAGERVDRAVNSGQSVGYIESRKHDYDREAQYITFASISTVIIYTVSAVINYNSVRKMNENSYPVFDLYISGNDDGFRGNFLSLRYNLRF